MEEFLFNFIKYLSILFFFVFFSPMHLLANIGNNSTDYESLIFLKHQLFEQQSSLSSALFMSTWNDTNKHFCSWKGVSCGRKHPSRVTSLDLSSSDLVGSLPLSITNLTFLKRLDLSNNNFYGFGRYGYVYRGTLRDYHATVAIKVFNLEVHGALKSFSFECDALRRIRHRNLIRVLTSCSSIDSQGKDFKALIFEFMPKGNLDIWLHQDYEKNEDDVLSLEKRLNIIINVADALEYLHHSCEPPIIHCDLKPSNILLDKNMIAYVGDFGLSRMLSEDVNISIQDHSNKNEIKGTIGYVAPEYGAGARPSTFTDIYSFGIILLEMLIGRRPTDDIFKDDLNIYNHVKMAFSHRIKSIIDLKMFTKEQRDVDYSSFQHINKCLLSLAEVGLSCSSSIPKERPSMRDVAAKLHTIKVSYLQSE